MGIQIGDDVTEKTMLRDAKFWIAWVRTKKPENRAMEWKFHKQRLIEYRGEEYVNALADMMNKLKNKV